MEQKAPKEEIFNRREANSITQLAYSDKVICCVECKEDFTWTVDEQLFFQKKGLFSRPKRCKSCKKNPIINTIVANSILPTPEPKKEIVPTEILFNVVGNGRKKIIMTPRNIEMLEQKGKVKLGFTKNQNVSILNASCLMTQESLLTLEAGSVLTFIIKK